MLWLSKKNIVAVTGRSKSTVDSRLAGLSFQKYGNNQNTYELSQCLARLRPDEVTPELYAAARDDGDDLHVGERPVRTAALLDRWFTRDIASRAQRIRNWFTARCSGVSESNVIIEHLPRLQYIAPLHPTALQWVTCGDHEHLPDFEWVVPFAIANVKHDPDWNRLFDPSDINQMENA
ncbi:hypothetical protein SAMN04488020_103205 [Palleronia marisminoris]|uniref:Uncharacterized protein n=1 Tax=Palleronia marisminoris TaxID=315423 RepID=A0A1Y5SDY8_9RHOB|nr:hypothetical protein [Palleronia marisminoris]SFG69187.1 hypothetical protein SAMN04488020_103205 [Palleronia marisminoris]SLN35455.1 hypothetical protein PAM7066_01485 [Palleronia marisminoris]